MLQTIKIGQVKKSYNQIIIKILQFNRDNTPHAENHLHLG